MENCSNFSPSLSDAHVVAYHEDAFDRARSPRGPHLVVRHDESGEAVSVVWHTPYGDPAFETLRRMARSHRGRWGGDAWTFPSTDHLQRFLRASSAIRAGWKRINKHPSVPGLRVTEFSDGYLVYWVPLKEVARSTHGTHALSEAESLATSCRWRFRSFVLKAHREFLWLMVVGPAVELRTEYAALIKSTVGATNESLPWLTMHPVRLTCRGWMLSIEFEVRDPRHLLVMGRFLKPLGYFDDLSDYRMDPVLTVDRSSWPNVANCLCEAGIEVTGDSPHQPVHPAARMVTIPPGWEAPAHNGHLLRPYQRDAVEFLLNRGLRAIVGDEMGLGKTAQVIAAIEAAQVGRVLVVAPLAARYVWETEIQAWSVAGPTSKVCHIVSGDESVPTDARWVIVSYDLLAEREAVWTVKSAAEMKELVSAFGSRRKVKIPTGEFPKRVRFSKAPKRTPTFADEVRRAKWEKVVSCLAQPLVHRLALADFDLVVGDEAHRAKNSDAKRTQAFAKLCAAARGVVLVTGTPVRNNAGEPLTLLQHVDVVAYGELDERRLDAVRHALAHAMLRRIKAEVLTELPAKIREVIPMDLPPSSEAAGYEYMLDEANRAFIETRAQGASELLARRAASRFIARARHYLGLAKALSGIPAQLAWSVVEEKGSVVVFAHHHDVIDELALQLRRLGARVRCLDGRDDVAARREIVSQFQSGELDAIVAGIQTAGESITLTRADTVVFAELDWVPAALEQAEDRIHRLGQEAQSCLAQTVLVRDPDGLDAIMASVIARKRALVAHLLEGAEVNSRRCSSIESEVVDQLLRARRGNPQR